MGGQKRLIGATPAGNSGFVTYFNSTAGNASDFQMTLNPDSLQLVSGPGYQGVNGTLSFNQNARMVRALLGGVRTVRDFVEGGGTMHPQYFNFTTLQQGPSVVLSYMYINGTGFMNLTFTPNDGQTTLAVLPENNFTVTIGGQGSGTVSFEVRSSETALQGTNPTDLFTADAGLANNPEAQQVAFLTYADRFLAGSWRFLTYFGRDTMIALRLFQSKLQPEPIEAAIGAVLERLNMDPNRMQDNVTIPVGTVCHEETIGDYASFINAQNKMYELGDAPYYDYKMIDSDYLMLPTLANYLLNLPQGANRSEEFLSQQATLVNNTYNELLMDNVNLILELAAPFAMNSTVENLIHLRETAPVGNWRDSNTGLGNGRIPYDVNTALVPGALRSIQALAAAGVIESNLEGEAAEMALAWEANALPLFEVRMPEAQALELLSNYSSNVSVPAPNGAPNSDIRFYALALNDDGSKVPVLHSDVGFNLLYGNNLPAELVSTVPFVLSPYPEGLLTSVGMVVANPVYWGTPEAYGNFTRGDYHGTVVWAFQQAIMVAGLQRQLGLCESGGDSTSDKPAWCDSQPLVNQLQASLASLEAAINNHPEVRYSETWSWTYTNGNYEVTPLGALSQGTESDAIQLWSYGFLSVDTNNSQGVQTI